MRRKRAGFFALTNGFRARFPRPDGPWRAGPGQSPGTVARQPTASTWRQRRSFVRMNRWGYSADTVSSTCFALLSALDPPALDPLALSPPALEPPAGIGCQPAVESAAVHSLPA